MTTDEGSGPPKAPWGGRFEGLPDEFIVEFRPEIDLDDGGGTRLAAGIRGWSVERLDAQLSADQIAALLPGTLGDYGWYGTMRARGAAFGCRWSRPRGPGRD